MAKKILLIDAHPYDKSLCSAIAFEYYEGARRSGFEIKLMRLRDLSFDPILHGGYVEPLGLEPDLKLQQELIKWCDHLVLVTPVWWVAVPALLKGFFDRVLLPGFAFKYGGASSLPQKLLEGKSATVFYTQGAPFFYSYFFFGDSFWKTLKKGVFEFCGFKPVKRIVYAFVSQSTLQRREGWLKDAYTKGLKGA